MYIPDYAFNDGTRAFYRDVAEFDKTICERERRELLADQLAHHYIGRVAVVKKAFPEKSVGECRVFCEDKRNWIGTKTDLAGYICDPKNKEFAEFFFEEFSIEDFTADKIPERALFEFLSAERGFRWVKFGGVWNGVCPCADEGVAKKAYRVTLPFNGMATIRVCAVDGASAYAQTRALASKGDFGDAVLGEERSFDFDSAVMEIER